jgi:hypothetical protein
MLIEKRTWTQEGVGTRVIQVLIAGFVLSAPLAAQEPVSQEARQRAQENGSSFLRSVQWNGHVAVSYTYNSTARSANTFRVFDVEARRITFHQLEFWVEKPPTVESPLGFGLDVMFGSDAKKIHATGLGDADDPFDLTQAYVSYRAPLGRGLEFKIGKFVTLHGAEVIRRPGNFNISRSILFGYAIPFTHTGLLATYSFTDRLSLTLGIVNGWDNVTDNNTGKSLHGMILLVPRKDLTLTVSGTWGPEQTDVNDPKRGMIDVVATYKPISPLTLMVNVDYGAEADAIPDGAHGAKRARWYGAAGYIIYELTPRWSAGLRGEFFNDRDGFRLGWSDPRTNLPLGLNLREVTGTIRHKIADQLFIHFEYRRDFANHPVFGPPHVGKRSQGTFSVELVYQLK